MFKVADKSFFHHNITLRKVFSFGIVSLIGMGIVTGGTYLLTDKLGIYYVWSTIITGAVAFGVKFVITAIWTFGK